MSKLTPPPMPQDSKPKQARNSKGHFIKAKPKPKFRVNTQIAAILGVALVFSTIGLITYDSKPETIDCKAKYHTKDCKALSPVKAVQLASKGELVYMKGKDLRKVIK